LKIIGKILFLKALIKKKNTVINNWVGIDLIKLIKNQNNSFKTKNNLRNRFVVSFTGVMRFAQGLNIVINCAELLRPYKDILFYFYLSANPDILEMIIKNVLNYSEEKRQILRKK